MKKYAVVTDAISSGFIFEKWYNYYATQFGGENIYLCTYGKKVGEFNSYNLGRVMQIGSEYNDDSRKFKINELVRNLLNIYDVVIRVDVDEFLVPENTIYDNLRSYLDKWMGPYITAKGFNIIEMPDDSRLNINDSILKQRKYAYQLTSMCKTAVTRLPIEWNRGFHYGNIPPKFNGLLLFHTKLASLDMQKNYIKYVLNDLKEGSFEYQYNSNALDSLNKFKFPRKDLENISFEESLNGKFIKEFENTIEFFSKVRLFETKKIHSMKNVCIPTEYEKYF